MSKLLNVAERALKLLQLLRKIMALLLWVMTRSLEHCDICICTGALYLSVHIMPDIQEHKYPKPKINSLLLLIYVWPVLHWGGPFHNGLRWYWTLLLIWDSVAPTLWSVDYQPLWEQISEEEKSGQPLRILSKMATGLQTNIWQTMKAQFHKC